MNALTLDTPTDLVRAFLAGRSPRTLDAYRRDLVDFAGFMALPTPENAVQSLLGAGQGAANGLALAYRVHLQERRLSPSTVNRRLAALRSVVKLARTLGIVEWSLDVQGQKSETYRDTSGPSLDGVSALFRAIDLGSPNGIRDRAILRLLFDLALRRGEVVSLDVEHVDLERGTVSILGKGKNERINRTLPPTTKEALAAWIEVRGTDHGPLFIGLAAGSFGCRLEGRGIGRILERLSVGSGVRCAPHGLRHAAITAALDGSHGDLRKVQRFSRHADVRTLERYDDNRTDMAGQVASMVSRMVA